MKRCLFCAKDIEDVATVCPYCNHDPSVSPTKGDYGTMAPPVVRVSVVDINMPFASMVGFMIKWALAAIPAFLILAVVGAFVVAIFAAFSAGL